VVDFLQAQLLRPTMCLLLLLPLLGLLQPPDHGCLYGCC
jgi:hypothetical protein